MEEAFYIVDGYTFIVGGILVEIQPCMINNTQRLFHIALARLLDTTAIKGSDASTRFLMMHILRRSIEIDCWLLQFS
jgi:hypothetical protein